MALQRIVVILGPTASGKSDLAIKIAKRFNGEVVSADSRQVYRGMDIGTGKVTKKEMGGIRHHLLDVADPRKPFTVVRYQKLALEAIKDILKRKKVPILVGGTGLYIQAIVDNIVFPQVPPEPNLRRKLEGKSAEELFGILKLLDPNRAKAIDRKNPRRLIRAIEIAMLTKKPLIPLQKSTPLFQPFFIGIARDKSEFKDRITGRFHEWLRRGFLKEVKALRKKGVPDRRIEEFGLHYREALLYLKKEIRKKEFVKNSIRELLDYTRRQMTWFKRDKRIHWVKNQKEAAKLVKEFLSRR